MNSDRFIFVIDTEQYAGNFEREMGSAVTGLVGEYFSDQCNQFAKECLSSNRSLTKSIQAKLGQAGSEYNDTTPDEYVAIWPTPGWFNHGMGGHFRDKQEDEALQDFFKEVQKYMKETGDKSLARNLNRKKVNKCPAYLSVAIFFNEKPTDKEIEFMKTRANEFAAKRLLLGNTKPIEITGFRLIKLSTNESITHL